MNFHSGEAIASAVLYEGYILYPYRPSAIKNQQRWNFGTLYPRAFAEAQGPLERWRFQAEMLIEATEETTLCARLRFLHLVAPGKAAEAGWEQGLARARTLDGITLADLLSGVHRSFDLATLAADERDQAPTDFQERPRRATLHLHAAKLREGLYRLRAVVSNESPVAQPDQLSHRSVQDLAFSSAHLLLGVASGAFVSLLEPDSEFGAEIDACRQDGVFPVLAGAAGDRTCVLCSPIILYDHPQVAPESTGDFFDGTEMDEMLALRVLTLTDAEKEEMRRGDPRARAILERTESSSNEQMLRVHGAVRDLHPLSAIDNEPTQAGAEARADHLDSRPDAQIDSWDPFADRPPVTVVRVFGVDVRTGDRVRLWPQKKADIMDLAMKGKVAIIEAIEQDLEDNVQFAVVLEDDPGRDMGMLRQAGHRFFFSPEEIEPLGLEVL